MHDCSKFLGDLMKMVCKSSSQRNVRYLLQSSTLRSEANPRRSRSECHRRSEQKLLVGLSANVQHPALEISRGSFYQHHYNKKCSLTSSVSFHPQKILSLLLDVLMCATKERENLRARHQGYRIIWNDELRELEVQTT